MKWSFYIPGNTRLKEKEKKHDSVDFAQDTINQSEFVQKSSFFTSVKERIRLTDYLLMQHVWRPQMPAWHTDCTLQ